MNLFEGDHRPSGMMLAYRHEHDYVEVGAQHNPNGTWSSLWGCTACPDIFVGGKVGPIPYGYCHRCRWVQRDDIGKRCEECKAGPEYIEGYDGPASDPKPEVTLDRIVWNSPTRLAWHD